MGKIIRPLAKGISGNAIWDSTKWLFDHAGVSALMNTVGVALLAFARNYFTSWERFPAADKAVVSLLFCWVVVTILFLGKFACGKFRAGGQAIAPHREPLPDQPVIDLHIPEGYLNRLPFTCTQWITIQNVGGSLARAIKLEPLTFGLYTIEFEPIGLLAVGERSALSM